MATGAAATCPVPAVLAHAAVSGRPLVPARPCAPRRYLSPIVIGAIDLEKRQVNGIPKKRHIPERSCIACGHKAPKGQLVRIVRTPDGPVIPDPSGKANGRGAYLCDRAGCWERGLARRSLERSLRAPVTGPDIEALQNYYLEAIASGGARRC